MNIWVFLCAQWKGIAELSGLVVSPIAASSGGAVEERGAGEWMKERTAAPCLIGLFSPGSRLSVWVRGAPCHRGLAHSGAQCPCQSRQHFLPPLAPALAGIHNISQLPTMACLPAPTIWLLWATILTHITNYSKSRGKGERRWRAGKPLGLVEVFVHRFCSSSRYCWDSMRSILTEDSREQKAVCAPVTRFRNSPLIFSSYSSAIFLVLLKMFFFFRWSPAETRAEKNKIIIKWANDQTAWTFQFLCAVTCLGFVCVN